MGENLLRGLSIFLVGMMGSGKTTIGQVLAQQLDYRFFDTDVLIERVTQQTINEIFAKQGEESFRDIESQVLAQLCAYTRSVVATGGGIVLKQLNWSYLRHGLIIWLDTPVELLLKRLAEDTTRPLLQESEPALKLNHLLEQRRSLYAEADLRILVEENQTPEKIVSQILGQIPSIVKTQLKNSYSEHN
jgi:shikimate kinase